MKKEQKKKTSIFLPQFTIGEDAFEGFEELMSYYGRSVAIIYGEKAWAASREYVLPALDRSNIQVCAQMCYGHDATYKNVMTITEKLEIHKPDMVIAVGGGKCMDTVKLVADRMGKPIFTIPSIASNCAPVTKISIMYHEDGTFRDIPGLRMVPIHCFIHPKIILAAPISYLRAGIGDAMAKHVESTWSAKAGERLDFGSQFGIIASKMCYHPMLACGEKAIADAKVGIVSQELEELMLSIMISPGITSVSVRPEYNGAIAHALFYGLTKRKHIEKHHLHGEVVSYGMLVNLIIDKNQELLKTAFLFYKSIGLPTCLKDLELDKNDPLDDVLDATLENQELVHTPYPVSKKMIYQGIKDLEHYGEVYSNQIVDK